MAGLHIICIRAHVRTMGPAWNNVRHIDLNSRTFFIFVFVTLFFLHTCATQLFGKCRCQVYCRGGSFRRTWISFNAWSHVNIKIWTRCASMWYFEEGCVVLWRGLCGTLKRVVWYIEEGCVVLWRGWCGTLKRVLWYFEEGGVILWRWWCGTLKRVVWYFEEGCVVL